MNDLKIDQPTRSLAIGVGAVSETGQREQNQDCMTGFTSPFGAIYLIADGMGGHRGGAEASRLVVEAFSRHLLAAPASAPAHDALTLAIRLTNIEVLEKSKSSNPDFQGMGSTVVVALLSRNGGGLQLTTAHVGDSRIYLEREGALTLLTKDHTQIQWLIDSKALDAAEARHHPDASILTRAIGHTVELEVDISDPMPLRPGDGILLCSDGLSGFVEDKDIHQLIERTPDPTTCASKLVELALASGSSDNITVQFLLIGEAVPPSPAVPVPTPAVRGRSRQTEPEEPLPPAHGPARSRRMTLAFVLSIALAVVLAAGWWMYRQWVSRRTLQGTADIHRTISNLNQRCKTLRSDSATLIDKATSLRRDVLGDIATLQTKSGPPTHGAKLQEFNAFNGLKKQLDDILSITTNIEKDAQSEADKATALEHSQTPSDQDAEIRGLGNSISGNEKGCKEQQANFEKVARKKTDLETKPKGT
jgi:serine/threonine protein phosphatase PrpC